MIRSRRSRGCGCVRLDARPIARMRMVAMLVLAACVPPLHAQTIVPNPNLDTQLAPWTPFASAAPDPVGLGTAPTWVASPDLNGSTQSGSALVDIDAGASAMNAGLGIAQCVDFNTPTLVSFLNYGMSFRMASPTADDGSVSATIEIRLFANSGCSGFISGGSQGQTFAPGISSATWYELSDNSFVPAGAPVMAASAQVRGYLRRTNVASTQANYRVNLDHFVLVLNSTTPVELMHFEVD